MQFITDISPYRDAYTIHAWTRRYPDSVDIVCTGWEAEDRLGTSTRTDMALVVYLHSLLCMNYTSVLCSRYPEHTLRLDHVPSVMQ